MITLYFFIVLTFGFIFLYVAITFLLPLMLLLKIIDNDVIVFIIAMLYSILVWIPSIILISGIIYKYTKYFEVLENLIQ
jgi:hypothetical protein